MKPALVDDRYLSEILRGTAVPRLESRDLFTTGYWYVRLCQAVLGGRSISGVLSGPFAGLPDGIRSRATAVVMQLPDAIGLVSLRELAPLMGGLRRRHSLNVLGMEALAAAEYLDADVFLHTTSPQLQAALAYEGLSVQLAE
ncbi:MAG: hypothetical protein ACYCV7_01425 [Acidimicrobiales bacterium]